MMTTKKEMKPMAFSAFSAFNVLVLLPLFALFLIPPIEGQQLGQWGQWGLHWDAESCCCSKNSYGPPKIISLNESGNYGAYMKSRHSHPKSILNRKEALYCFFGFQIPTKKDGLTFKYEKYGFTENLRTIYSGDKKECIMRIKFSGADVKSEVETCGGTHNWEKPGGSHNFDAIGYRFTIPKGPSLFNFNASFVLLGLVTDKKKCEFKKYPDEMLICDEGDVCVLDEFSCNGYKDCPKVKDESPEICPKPATRYPRPTRIARPSPVFGEVVNPADGRKRAPLPTEKVDWENNLGSYRHVSADANPWVLFMLFCVICVLIALLALFIFVMRRNTRPIPRMGRKSLRVYRAPKWTCDGFKSLFRMKRKKKKDKKEKSGKSGSTAASASDSRASASGATGSGQTNAESGSNPEVSSSGSASSGSASDASGSSGSGAGSSSSSRPWAAPTARSKESLQSAGKAAAPGAPPAPQSNSGQIRSKSKELVGADPGDGQTKTGNSGTDSGIGSMSSETGK